MPIRAAGGVKGRVDWPFVLAGAGLVLIGTLAILSAASPLPYYIPILERHFLAMALGAFLFVIGLSLNYQIYQDQAKVIYGLVLAMMILVLVIGSTQRGHKSWFHFSFITFQPAELARLGVILVLAAFLDSRGRRIDEFSTIALTLALIGPVLALIVKQPDFSSALTFLPIVIGMLFCAGASLAHILAFAVFAATAAAVPIVSVYVQVRYPEAAAGSWAHGVLQISRFSGATFAVMGAATLLSFFGWRLAAMLRLHARALAFVMTPAIFCAGLTSGILVNHRMKGYQRNRFVAYVAPQADIQGASYNVHQAQIAIGSGSLRGKGLFAGTQSRLGFLPERHTDFIYAVVGEEMGFVGTGAILALYLLLIWRIVGAARLARDRYGFLVCAGLATMFAFQFMLNVGMCLGLAPVAGVPLPLISYGGSSLVITLLSLGIVANVYSRRYALL